MGDKKNDESTSSVNNTSSLASPLIIRIVSNAKFAVEFFDGSGYFGMWQGEVLYVLQQGLDIAIEQKKPDGVGERRLEDYQPCLLAVILPCKRTRSIYEGNICK